MTDSVDRVLCLMHAGISPAASEGIHSMATRTTKATSVKVALVIEGQAFVLERKVGKTAGAPYYAFTERSGSNLVLDSTTLPREVNVVTLNGSKVSSTLGTLKAVEGLYQPQRKAEDWDKDTNPNAFEPDGPERKCVRYKGEVEIAGEVFQAAIRASLRKSAEGVTLYSKAGCALRSWGGRSGEGRGRVAQGITLT